MDVEKLTDLAPSEERAVIINVNTKLVTTLALLSAIKYVDMPILVIDCESDDGSLEHIRKLHKDHEFDFLSAPLKQHGETLNWLFKNIPSNKVLLIDSDLEILNSEPIEMMRTFIDRERVFGCGFVHGPCWLPTHRNLGYYNERMWIPFTFLKVSLVRKALEAGCSFVDRTIYNDFAASALLSRILALRFRFSSTRNWRLRWMDWFKANYNGLKPCYVYCDTGSVIYHQLKNVEELYFVGFRAELHQEYVTHYHGVTRILLDPKNCDINSHSLDDISDRVKDRLKNVYKYDI